MSAKKPRASTAAKPNPVVDQSGWRHQLMTKKIKFDDEQKRIYLEALAEHGLKGRAAEAAGVSMECVRRHTENDPQFAEALGLAMEEYRDKIVDHHRRLVLDGIEVRKYNKDGDLIEERRDYPIRLIELELKRVDPAYRDKQTIDLNATAGGVLVAPAGVSPEEWIKREQEKNNSRKPPEVATDE